MDHSFTSDTDILFRPISLNGLELKNRIVMAPMTRRFSPSGIPGTNVADYYRRRAEGGTGLIITEGTTINRPAASNDADIPNFYAPESLAGWANVVSEVHKAGGRIAPQLWHQGLARPAGTGPSPEAPSEGPTVSAEGSRAMTDSDIADTIDAFAKSAAAAQKIGFDAVELHGAHGYLIDEFLWSGLNTRTFLPVVIATGSATYVGRIFFGIESAFSVPSGVLPELLFPSAAQFLPVYVLFGLLCGVAAAVFVKFLHWMEDLFEDMPLNPYVKNVIGMTFLGVMMYTFFLIYGRYFTDGVGYAPIQDILSGDLQIGYLLAILFFAKLLATSVSLAAGASGGVFSPSLFLGATLGGCFGVVLSSIWPHLGFVPMQFAIIGMAAIVGGGTGAAMTAILMIFEMTGDYTTIVPVIIAVASAIGMRRLIIADNIYTMKLTRRGQHIPRDRHSHLLPPILRP
jgi:CIC family chloride channel protein